MRHYERGCDAAGLGVIQITYLPKGNKIIRRQPRLGLTVACGAARLEIGPHH